MKNLIFVMLGLAAAAVCVIASTPRSPRTVDDLAHKLQDAWADNHTVA